MGKCFHFGTFTLYPESGEMFRAKRKLRVGAQEALFLTALAEAGGQFVSRTEMEARLWPHQLIGVNCLNVVASRTRKLLGENPANPKFIKTVGRRGYCFIHPIHVSEDQTPESASAADYHYQLGLHLVEVRTEESLKQSFQAFRRAIAGMPNHALAYAGLADAFIVSAMYGVMHPGECFLRARSAAARALRIAPELTEAKCAEAWVKLCLDRDWTGAHEGFGKVVRERPDYPRAWNGLSMLMCAIGRGEEAIEAMRKAWTFDADSPTLSALSAIVYYRARRFREAAEQARRALLCDENSALANECLGLSCLQLGEHPRAIEQFQRAYELGKGPVVLGFLGHAYAVSGNRKQAQAILEELMERRARDYVLPQAIALVHAGLQQREQAFFWLEKSCDEHSHSVLFLPVEPMLDDLRRDERFTRLLVRVGFPQQVHTLKLRKR
jgi:DNA-binding winged helix-turn-helix (wHTH) protein/Flp pilus assembly protein TadD